jgi:mRNA interferase MazF
MRPVIVVSNEAANRHSPVVTVVPLTSKIKPNRPPTNTTVHAKGLQVPSAALCEQLMTVDRSRLVNRIGYIQNRAEQNAIRRGLQIQLGLVPPQKFSFHSEKGETVNESE